MLVFPKKNSLLKKRFKEFTPTITQSTRLAFFSHNIPISKAQVLHVSKLQAVFRKQDVPSFDLHVALEINTSVPFLRRWSSSPKGPARSGVEERICLVAWVKLGGQVVI